MSQHLRRYVAALSLAPSPLAAALEHDHLKQACTGTRRLFGCQFSAVAALGGLLEVEHDHLKGRHRHGVGGGTGLGIVTAGGLQAYKGASIGAVGGSLHGSAVKCLKIAGNRGGLEVLRPSVRRHRRQHWCDCLGLGKRDIKNRNRIRGGG